MEHSPEHLDCLRAFPPTSRRRVVQPHLTDLPLPPPTPNPPHGRINRHRLPLKPLPINPDPHQELHLPPPISREESPIPAPHKLSLRPLSNRKRVVQRVRIPTTDQIKAGVGGLQDAVAAAEDGAEGRGGGFHGEGESVVLAFGGEGGEEGAVGADLKSRRGQGAVGCGVVGVAGEVFDCGAFGGRERRVEVVCQDGGRG